MKKVFGVFEEPKKKRFGVFDDEPKTRPIWDGWVDQSRQIPNSMDGSTAPRAIPAPLDHWYDEEQKRFKMLGLLTQLGRVPWDTADQYCKLMDMFASGELTRMGVEWADYSRMKADLGRVSSARATALRMGWKLTPEQLKFLADRGM
jgi:hypothetical protein